MRSTGSYALATLAIFMFGAPPISKAADERLSLYKAMEIVTGTDMRERPRGFIRCLEDVLVKVSGDPRLRTDARVAEIKQHAADYVVSFDYVDPISGTRPKDDQGTYDRSENLTVRFDPAKIDTLVESLGDRPWRAARPVLIPVLSVHGRKPPAWLLSAEEPSAAEQRTALERVANEAGLAVRFPTATEFRRWGVGLETVAPAAPCGPPGTIVVRGSLDWSEVAPGWVGAWRTCWQGKPHVWASLGGGYDLAFQNMIDGVMLLATGLGRPETPPAHARY